MIFCLYRSVSRVLWLDLDWDIAISFLYFCSLDFSMWKSIYGPKGFVGEEINSPFSFTMGSGAI